MGVKMFKLIVLVLVGGFLLSNCTEKLVFVNPEVIPSTNGNSNGSGPNYMPPNANWELAWSDEFSNSSIDTNTWSHETGFGNNGWGNNELQNYTSSSDNSYISSGRLVIEAKHNGGNATQRGSYTSARMISRDKLAFKYGLVVARMKSPRGRGVWPAIWLLGQNIGSVGWPRCGEIDIFEMFGDGGSKDQQTTGALHWCGESTGCNQSGTPCHRYCGYSRGIGENLSLNFHNYALEWNETMLIWRFDGEVVATHNIENQEYDEFRANNFFLLLNIAVGGNPVPDPDTSIFPQKMEIDWIRIYTNVNQVGGSISMGN